METWDAILSRRNVRDYADRPITDGDLDQILEAGRRSPSSRNGQPWDFVVVADRERLRELAMVWQNAGHVARSAATVALVAGDAQGGRQRDQLQYDLGQATMAMLIAAADLGIGSGHSAVEDQQRAQEVLGFPDGRFCAYLIAFGYPVDRPLGPLRRINRRPFSEVVHRERW